MTGNCPGTREQGRDGPLDMCRTCQHWISTSGATVYPLIQIVTLGRESIVTCGRRRPVQAEG